MALVCTIAEAFPDDKIGGQENTNQDVKNTKSSCEIHPASFPNLKTTHDLGTDSSPPAQNDKLVENSEPARGGPSHQVGEPRVRPSMTLERIPAMGPAESLAKSGYLANLFERSELFATMIWPRTKVPQRGRGQAEVVLATFAETKVARSPGRNPATQKTRLTANLQDNEVLDY
jgi:hypothetical protein